MNTTTTCQKIKVRECQIVCNDHLDWGTFGVYEDKGDFYEIGNVRGHRILSKYEADKFWSVI
jgi:hypothetical protein